MKRTKSVDCHKRFPVFQANSMCQMACFGRGSTWIEDTERLPVDWERERDVHCSSIQNLEIFLNHSCNSHSLATPVFW